MGTIDIQVRRAVLAGNSESIRRLLLNDNQIWLVGFVRREKRLTASGLAGALSVSVQNASAKLNRLYQAGYIQRQMIASESGGIEYVYTSIDI